MNQKPWRPIKNTPKDGRRILLSEYQAGKEEWYNIIGQWIEAPHLKKQEYEPNVGWFSSYIAIYTSGPLQSLSWDCKPIIEMKPTHWLPLPSPPTRKPLVKKSTKKNRKKK